MSTHTEPSTPAHGSILPLDIFTNTNSKKKKKLRKFSRWQLQSVKPCAGYFSRFGVKVPDKSNLRKGRVYSGLGVRVHSITEGRLWWWRCKAAGHFTSEVRKQRKKRLTGCTAHCHLYTQFSTLSHSVQDGRPQDITAHI